MKTLPIAALVCLLACAGCTTVPKRPATPETTAVRQRVSGASTNVQAAGSDAQATAGHITNARTLNAEIVRLATELLNQ